MSKSNPLGIRLIDNNYLVRKLSLEAHRKISINLFIRILNK